MTQTFGITELRDVVTACVGTGDDVDITERTLAVAFPDLGLDSLAVYEITSTLQDRFGIRIPDDDVAELTTPAHVIGYVNDHLAGGRSAVTSPTVRMMEYQNGLRLAYLLSALAELGVADHLVAGPLPVADLAERTGAHADSLYRAMRAVASKGVFTEVAPHVFAMTELAATLVSDVDGSLRDVFRMQGRPFLREVYADIGHTVRTGEPAFQHVHGTDLFTYLSTRPAESKLFSGAMGNAIRHVQNAALDAYDLTGVRHVVDVGGAHGQLLAAILLRHPAATGVVFDRPEVVPGAEAVLAAAGVSDRAERVGGDYFVSVPPGGDVYVLSHVIHQVGDADAVRVLRNIRDVIAPGGRVVLVDPVLPEGDTPHAGKFMDITMMALTTGRDRTEREIRQVLADAGFRHTDTIGSAAPSSVVVAVPA